MSPWTRDDLLPAEEYLVPPNGGLGELLEAPVVLARDWVRVERLAQELGRPVPGGGLVVAAPARGTHLDAGLAGFIAVLADKVAPPAHEDVAAGHFQTHGALDGVLQVLDKGDARGGLLGRGHRGRTKDGGDLGGSGDVQTVQIL